MVIISVAIFIRYRIECCLFSRQAGRQAGSQAKRKSITRNKKESETNDSPAFNSTVRSTYNNLFPSCIHVIALNPSNEHSACIHFFFRNSMQSVLFFLALSIHIHTRIFYASFFGSRFWAILSPYINRFFHFYCVLLFLHRFSFAFNSPFASFSTISISHCVHGFCCYCYSKTCVHFCLFFILSVALCAHEFVVAISYTFIFHRISFASLVHLLFPSFFYSSTYCCCCGCRCFA